MKLLHGSHDARAGIPWRGRFVRRRDRLMETFVGAGLMPVDRIVRKSLERLDPYALRKEALDRRLSPSEIGRALFHLNQRCYGPPRRKTEWQGIYDF